MAEIGKVTVGVRVAIPDETVERCMRILEMWMDDHPDCNIVCEQLDAGDHLKHKIKIIRREDYGEK